MQMYRAMIMDSAIFLSCHRLFFYNLLCKSCKLKKRGPLSVVPMRVNDLDCLPFGLMIWHEIKSFGSADSKSIEFESLLWKTRLRTQSEWAFWPNGSRYKSAKMLRTKKDRPMAAVTKSSLVQAPKSKESLQSVLSAHQQMSQKHRHSCTNSCTRHRISMGKCRTTHRRSAPLSLLVRAWRTATCYRMRLRSPNSCQRYFLAIASS